MAAVNGKEIDGNILKVGWSKAVILPLQPMYSLAPESLLPFRAFRKNRIEGKAPSTNMLSVDQQLALCVVEVCWRRAFNICTFGDRHLIL